MHICKITSTIYIHNITLVTVTCIYIHNTRVIVMLTEYLTQSPKHKCVKTIDVSVSSSTFYRIPQCVLLHWIIPFICNKWSLDRLLSIIKCSKLLRYHILRWVSKQLYINPSAKHDKENVIPAIVTSRRRRIMIPVYICKSPETSGILFMRSVLWKRLYTMVRQRCIDCMSTKGIFKSSKYESKKGRLCEECVYHEDHEFITPRYTNDMIEFEGCDPSILWLCKRYTPRDRIPRQHEWAIYDLRHCMLPARDERYKLSDIVQLMNETSTKAAGKHSFSMMNTNVFFIRLSMCVQAEIKCRNHLYRQYVYMWTNSIVFNQHRRNYVNVL
jgi:hypothetical protein